MNEHERMAGIPSREATSPALLHGPPPSYSSNANLTSNFTTNSGTDVLENRGVPQGSNFTPCAPEYCDLPPTYEEAQKLHTQPHIPERTPAAKRTCWTLRNLVMNITFMKTIWLTLSIVYVSFYIHNWASVHRETSNREISNITDQGTTATQDLTYEEFKREYPRDNMFLDHSILTAVLDITVQGTSLLAYVIGFIGALKRRARWVLICISINLVIDSAYMSIIISYWLPFNILAWVLEASFIYIMTLYYKYLKSNEK